MLNSLRWKRTCMRWKWIPNNSRREEECRNIIERRTDRETYTSSLGHDSVVRCNRKYSMPISKSRSILHRGQLERDRRLLFTYLILFRATSEQIDYLSCVVPHAPSCERRGKRSRKRERLHCRIVLTVFQFEVEGPDLLAELSPLL